MEPYLIAVMRQYDIEKPEATQIFQALSAEGILSRENKYSRYQLDEKAVSRVSKEENEENEEKWKEAQEQKQMQKQKPKPQQMKPASSTTPKKKAAGRSREETQKDMDKKLAEIYESALRAIQNVYVLNSETLR